MLRRARPLLGTLVQIEAAPRLVRGADCGTERIVDAAFAAIERVHRRMSFHDPDSDVSRLNRGAHRAPVAVDPLTWTLLRIARRIAVASGGAFDITIAPRLVERALLPRPAGGPPPRAGARQPAIALRAGGRVAFAEPLWIDLGGIAKGYAVDLACQVLEGAGVRDYVVNAGGDLRVGRSPVPIRLRHPGAPGTLLALGSVAGGAVASSGDYFSRRAADGGPGHPIIAPATGSPARYAGSITVLAPDCVYADALTKVVAVLGDQAAAILQRFGARALLVAPDGVQRELAAAPEPARARAARCRTAGSHAPQRAANRGMFGVP